MSTHLVEGVVEVKVVVVDLGGRKLTLKQTEFTKGSVTKRFHKKAKGWTL